MIVAVPNRSSRLKSAPATHTSEGTRTLTIDIGGSGLKALILDAKGSPLTDRARVETPRPATPTAVLEALWTLIEPLGDFDRISCGFPGVVTDGVIRTAVNLHPDWKDFALAQAFVDRTRRPARVLNDAGVQGFGVIEGHGLEMVITLGTGMGTALYIDGHYVPNIELAHHPFRGKKTYEDLVGAAAYAEVGKRRWRKRVHRVIEQILPIFNPRILYVGGGNAKHLKEKLPPQVKITSNVAGLLGGIALWDEPGLDLKLAPVPATGK